MTLVAWQEYLGCRGCYSTLCFRLRELNLSHNLLSTLPPDVFYLPSLQYLNASHNKLAHFAREHSQENDSLEFDTVPGHNSGGSSQWYTPRDEYTTEDDLGELQICLQNH